MGVGDNKNLQRPAANVDESNVHHKTAHRPAADVGDNSTRHDVLVQIAIKEPADNEEAEAVTVAFHDDDVPEDMMYMPHGLWVMDTGCGNDLVGEKAIEGYPIEQLDNAEAPTFFHSKCENQSNDGLTDVQSNAERSDSAVCVATDASRSVPWKENRRKRLLFHVAIRRKASADNAGR